MGTELLGAIISVVSAFSGFLLGRAHRPTRRPPKEVCQCEHEASFHDGHGCHGTIELPITKDSYGTPLSFKNVPCACVRYVGPNSSYVPELEG